MCADFNNIRFDAYSVAVLWCSRHVASSTSTFFKSRDAFFLSFIFSPCLHKTMEGYRI